MSEQRKILSVNQGRVVADDIRAPWTDACNGHDDLYAAIACSERQSAIVKQSDGTALGEALHGFVQKALAVAGSNARMEHRVVKRTITVTEEVVDGVGAEGTQPEAHP